MKTHVLKILPEYFAPVVNGTKTAEVRCNDRDYRVGDILILREMVPPDNRFTGAVVTVTVEHVANLNLIMPGYVLLSFTRGLSKGRACAQLSPLRAGDVRDLTDNPVFLKSLINCNPPNSIVHCMARRLLGEVNQ